MLPDFDGMTCKELKKYAKENDIDLGDTKKKSDIIKHIKQYYNIKEESVMDEEKIVNQEETEVGNTEVEGNVLAGEMEGNEAVDTAVPSDAVATNTRHHDTRIWHDAAGDEVSMSQFIREQFVKNNLSRKEISEKFEINYRTVYGATVNMVNDAEPASRGRGSINPKINVTADDKVFTEESTGEGEEKVTKYFLNGEEIAPDEAGDINIPETVETDRNSWIKEQVAAGVSRGDIAKILNLSYGVVYGLTKDEANTRQKYEVTIPDPKDPEKTITIARSEYIRQLVAQGMTKSDVAKKLGVEYSVVWQATKKDKTEAEKFSDLVENLGKYVDKIDDVSSVSKDAFKDILAQLQTVTIAEPKTEDSDK